jgi:tRNA (uracil-5-)-methyltransferase
VIEVNPKGVKERSQIAEIQQQLLEFLEKNCEDWSRFQSILWKEYDGMGQVAPIDTPLTVLHGQDHIVDELMGIKFRINAKSFYQVNSANAKLLYGKVGEYALHSSDGKDVTVLDICCGIGSIGLTLAPKVKKVIGVEIIDSAIEDAKENARINGFENTEFHCGKAEEILKDLLWKSFANEPEDQKSRAVAIVNPPRDGLKRQVIREIRKCPVIDQVVYVSCNPKKLIQNVETFMRHESASRQGRPFYPVKAVAVDMFPHTEHMEMAILLKRSTGFAMKFIGEE